jgi:prephenate dehydrogenase
MTPATATTSARRANVVGLGLIGGSVARALRARGWHVSGDDLVGERSEAAARLGYVDAVGLDPDAELSVVATPVGAAPAAIARALASTSGVVTDVGSTKAAVVAAVGPEPRYVGGHPMAGSELDGLDGADPTLFEGAVWVLTPTAATADPTFARVAEVVSELGAEVVALPPGRHDALVAVVSHVPHLAAATLMVLADERAEEHAALLRLAAGGFRDMTRIAAGQPRIWLDICADNQAAILDALDGLLGGLAEMRAIVEAGDRTRLESTLARARRARANLPSRVARSEDLAEVLVPIPDRAGAAAEIFTLAAELGVNIADFEVSHSAEGDKGVLHLVVERAVTDLFRGGLLARGFRPGVRPLG